MTKTPSLFLLLALGSPFTAQLVADDSPPPSQAVTAAATLDPAIVTAGKFPQKPQDIGSTITVLDGAQMVSQHQIYSLADVLSLSPGTTINPNGARGAGSAVFLRGTNANQSQLVVDGIRVSNANVFSDPFFGGDRLFNVASVEVLRGPQSALYGGEAIGGVISMTTRRGSGPPSYHAFAEVGSFGSLQSALSGQGSSGNSAYSFHLGQELTDNDRPHNAFRQFDSSLRLDHALSDSTDIGLTLRQASRRFESPGSIYTSDPDNIDRDNALLGTIFLNSRVTDSYETRLTLGGLLHEFEFETPPTTSHIDSRIATVDWRNILRAGEHHTLLAGVNAENTWSKNTGFGSIHDSEFLFALYLQDTVQITEDLTLTGGARWENYESFGDVATWRTTGSYSITPLDARLHSSIGTGFRAPSFFELYAQDDFFSGNPDLDPEESIGWDAGIEKRLGDSLTLDITYFQNRLSDLIVTSFDGGTSSVSNVHNARTQGLETALQADFHGRLRAVAQYTYLEAQNRTTGDDLLRRPTHSFAIDLNADLTDRILVGLGVSRIDGRSDIDALTFETIPGDSYTLWRAYARAALTDNIHATLRVENAADESYDEIDGFPGRGFGIFGGLTVTF